jgi:hypothetical protein
MKVNNDLYPELSKDCPALLFEKRGRIYFVSGMNKKKSDILKHFDIVAKNRCAGGVGFQKSLIMKKYPASMTKSQYMTI